MISHADKGNSTVIVSRDEYMSEMSKLFEDRSKYKILNKEPTRIYERKSNDIIKILLERKHVPQNSIKTKYNSIAPKAYGLRKTHKQSIAYIQLSAILMRPATRYPS